MVELFQLFHQLLGRGVLLLKHYIEYLIKSVKTHLPFLRVLFRELRQHIEAAEHRYLTTKVHEKFKTDLSVHPFQNQTTSGSNQLVRLLLIQLPRFRPIVRQHNVVAFL